MGADGNEIEHIHENGIIYLLVNDILENQFIDCTAIPVCLCYSKYKRERERV